MILRQLISIFLIQALLLTSVNAYSPKHLQENFELSAMSVFLMNEDRELRCQLTLQNAELFSLEQLQGLTQSDALAVMVGDALANELRPCDEDDRVYAEIVFADPHFAMAIDPSGMGAAIVTATAIFSIALIGIGGIAAMVIIILGLIGVGGKKSKVNQQNNDQNQEIQNFQETARAICGEKNALVTRDGVQCLDK